MTLHESAEDKTWMQKHRFLVWWLRLSKREALLEKTLIEDLASNMRARGRRAILMPASLLAALAVAVAYHILFVHDTSKLLYLIGFGLALIGTVFLSYGYFAYPQGIAPSRGGLASLPVQPHGQEYRDLIGYTQNVYRFFETYFRELQQEGVRDETRVEKATVINGRNGATRPGLPGPYSDSVSLALFPQDYPIPEITDAPFLSTTADGDLTASEIFLPILADRL